MAKSFSVNKDREPWKVWKTGSRLTVLLDAHKYGTARLSGEFSISIQPPSNIFDTISNDLTVRPGLKFQVDVTPR